MIKVLRNFQEILSLKTAYEKDGRHLRPDDSDIVSNGSIVFNEKEILWVGEDSKLPKEYATLDFKDCSHLVVTPELVDSHTHAIFGGNRANEYSMRLNGADYQEIARSGGGILATTIGTNALSASDLFDSTVEKIERIHSYGIGTVEIKSGYALNYEREKLCSEVIEQVKKHFGNRVQIFNTYLAAHAVPKDYSSSNAYLKQVVIPLLEELAPKNIIDAIDIFHEQGYFDIDDTRELFTVAKNFGIEIKIHADEFADNGGAKIASEFGALSADHLLCTGKEGIKALANSSTVATVLPGTGWFLGKPQANALDMLNLGCKVAIASDYNPGSCHCDNLLQIAAMSAPMYPMNMTQMWSAITLNAAASLGLHKQGAIVAGLKPRFSTFKVQTISEITYSWGRNFSCAI